MLRNRILEIERVVHVLRERKKLLVVIVEGWNSSSLFSAQSRKASLVCLSALRLQFQRSNFSKSREECLWSYEMKRDWNFGNWHEWKRFFFQKRTMKNGGSFFCEIVDSGNITQTSSKPNHHDLEWSKLNVPVYQNAYTYSSRLSFLSIYSTTAFKIQLSKKTWKMLAASNAARVCNWGGEEELNANSTNKSTHFTVLGHLTFHNSEHGSHCQPQSVTLEKASPNAQSIGDIPFTPHRWQRGKDVIFTSAFSHRNTFLATWRSNAEGLLLIGNFSLYLALSLPPSNSEKVTLSQLINWWCTIPRIM